jgi:hypothetical protein
MPVKTSYMTEQELRNIPLPNHGGKYAVISHGDIIDETKRQLLAAGFNINNELYKTSLDGQIAQGVYHLEYGFDADMGLMFAWSNSYNKQQRFKCAAGAQVFICMNGVVSGDMSNFNRKHMGKNAMQDAISSIQNQISNAKVYYNNLVQDKDMLKNIILSPRDKGSILGELFANDEILTLTQVGIVKRELDKPTHTYNADGNSAWSMYNYITFALKESHPGHYINDHQKVHQYFVDRFGRLVTVPIETVIHETVKEDIEIIDLEEKTSYVYETVQEGSDFDIDLNSVGVNFL